MNLGNAFADRVEGHRWQNVEHAITCYKNALEVWTKESALQDSAKVHVKPGNALRRRI